MSQSIGSILDLSFISTNDLSAKQYYVVKMDTSNTRQVVLCAANTDLYMGVLQNKPKAAEIAQVRCARGLTSKVVVTNAVSKGDKLMPNTDGTVLTATSGTLPVCGIALEAATATGQIIEMLLVDSYIA